MKINTVNPLEIYKPRGNKTRLKISLKIQKNHLIPKEPAIKIRNPRVQNTVIPRDIYKTPVNVTNPRGNKTRIKSTSTYKLCSQLTAKNYTQKNYTPLKNSCKTL